MAPLRYAQQMRGHGGLLVSSATSLPSLSRVWNQIRLAQCAARLQARQRPPELRRPAEVQRRARQAWAHSTQPCARCESRARASDGAHVLPANAAGKYRSRAASGAATATPRCFCSIISSTNAGNQPAAAAAARCCNHSRARVKCAPRLVQGEPDSECRRSCSALLHLTGCGALLTSLAAISGASPAQPRPVINALGRLRPPGPPASAHQRSFVAL